ncbi:MAG: NUDIX domain-containing protein [Ruminococcus sp.]|nr:NUDIX domain-containing protein [Ruminococcus sp.]
MEDIEIYLNRLHEEQENWRETASKLNAPQICSKETLEKWLAEHSELPKVKLYVSNEEISSPAIDQIIEAFAGRAQVITDEFLNIIDETAHMTALSKPRSLVHRDGDLHAAVHIWIIRRRDMGVYVLLQKRSHLKEISPDCYDVSAAGHVTQNGEFRSTAIRETAEEIGLEIPREQLELIGLTESRYADDHTQDNEIRAVYLYRGQVDEESLVLQESEVAEVCWAELDELLTVIKNEDFKHCLDLEELAMIKKAVF